MQTYLEPHCVQAYPTEADFRSRALYYTSHAKWLAGIWGGSLTYGLVIKNVQEILLKNGEKIIVTNDLKIFLRERKELEDQRFGLPGRAVAEEIMRQYPQNG
ncbi:hypothetical protein [Chryseolinea lacunae]|uniref:Uncharacterized protein n=1 Tax=Chryseolinea lacunae TaxID=2801331 RepID=A0ABS1KZV6_9BACT|nr:hypothetical protein [Chryseolinea lacunae]MBL0744797.1 hypothetical protein [Chryseolinea lacunae]